MRSFMLTLLVLCAVMNSYAQFTVNLYIKDSKTKESLPGAVVSIPGTPIGGSANEHGLVTLAGVPAGEQRLYFKAIGYEELYDTLYMSMSATDTPVRYLVPEDREMEELVVSSTRSSRTIQDIPTRIELIGADELNEKADMKPGDIRMLLGESTGIQTLQTSATSGNSGIRIEGLDGRYTQVLKDGFPLYAGFSSGLGLLQTPPLDLKRVEIIKGASSTLYGGGAIAGLINLISKTPATKKELSFLINGTTTGGMDVNGFYSQRFHKVGITLYAAYNMNPPYAPDNTVFTAIPKFSRYTFNPKLFFYLSDKTDVIVGLNTTIENRAGGDIYYIRGNGDSAHSYFEDNKTERISSEFQLTHRFDASGSLVIKNSFSYFNRIINAPGYEFSGIQQSTFTEIAYSTTKAHTEWIAGGNLFTDGFKEQQLTATPLRNYVLGTYGAFIQNTWNINKKVILETGLRGDYVVNYGLAVLPRVSILYKISSAFSSRVGGGLGYKAPTIFSEESERIIYRNVLPVNPDSNRLERSYGANGDINYKTTFANGKVTFSVNQLFFYTRLNHPLILTGVTGGLYEFQNLSAHIDAQGAETNVKIGYVHFKLFLGYTYTHSHIHKNGFYSETPLTPKHHTNSVLMYEVEGKWRVGAEAYYYSTQLLSDGQTGRDYWLCGFMAEKIWKKVSVFINFENMLDSRQTRFGSIYTGTVTDPVFRDIYAPLDGFVANGGVKLRF